MWVGGCGGRTLSQEGNNLRHVYYIYIYAQYQELYIFWKIKDNKGFFFKIQEFSENCQTLEVYIEIYFLNRENYLTGVILTHWPSRPMTSNNDQIHLQ